MNSSTRRPRAQKTWQVVRSWILVMMAGLLVMAAALAGAQPAHAATTAQIDTIEFTNDTFAGGSRQEINVTWSVPDNPSTPLTVTVPLPDELQGYSDRFPAIGADGEIAGECLVSTTEVVCTIDDDYVTANPVDISGSFTFLATVDLYNHEQIDHTFEFGDIEVGPITIDRNPAVCFENCDYRGTGHWKGGSYNNLNDTITWTVQVPAPADGIAAGQQITVTDQLDTSVFELIGQPRVAEGRKIATDPRTNREYVVYNTKPAGQVSVTNNGLTVEFTSVAGIPADQVTADGERAISGSAYQVQWTVKVLDEGKAKTYTNKADYTIEGQTVTEVSGSATRYSGSGTVVGRNFGKFAVTKQLDGDATFTPARSFTLKWTAYDLSDPNDPGVDGQTTLRAGETFFSDEIFKNTRVKIWEVAPAGPDNVTWSTPQFLATDANGNPVPGASPTDEIELVFSADNQNLGKVTYFTLTNEAVLEKDTFDVRKQVENPDNVDLSGISGYTLRYTYPASDTWAAGSGTMTIAPGSRPVTSAPLPVGAVVTFTEVLPTIPGATWAQPEISPKTITIGEGRSALVTVKNTITKDYGSFSIQKNVTGTGAELVPEGTTFQVHWSHPAGPGYEAGEGDIEVAAGGDPVVVDKVPAGAQITLTEAAPDPITGGDWLDPVFSQETFTVIKDQTVTIDLDNPILLQSGEFQVKKLFDGTGTELVPADMTFTVEYSYPAGVGFEAGEGTITVGADGELVSSGDLPHGAEITLTEPDPGTVLGGTWEGFSFSPQTFTIEGKQTVEVTLTNTITRDIGSVEISKTVTGQAAGLVGDDATFTFEWSYDEGPLGGKDGQTPIYPADSGQVEVPGDGTPVTLDGLPAGAEVTFTEVTPDAVTGGTWQPVTWTDGPQVTVEKDGDPDDDRVSVEAVNEITLNTGGFSIAKSLTGAGAELIDPDTEYVVNYTYGPGIGFEAGSGSLTVKADGTPVTVEDLPYGAEIVFEEVAPTAVDGTTWQEPGFSQGSITIGDQTVVAIELTNTATLNTGGFSIAKSLTGTGAELIDPDTEYVVNYSYEAGPGFEAGSGSLTVKADGTPVTVEDLPYGAEVVFEEVAPTAVEGTTWQAPVFSQESITIGDQTVVAIELTNTATLNTGGFTMVKSLTGTGADLVDPDTEYVVNYSYEAGPGFAAGSGSITLKADGTPVTIEGLPFGATVVFSEEAPADVDGATWSGHEFSASTVTIGDGTVVEITLTNTITTDEVPPTPEDLADTGSPATGPVILGAIALVVAGAVLLVGARRRAAVRIKQ